MKSILISTFLIAIFFQNKSWSEALPGPTGNIKTLPSGKWIAPLEDSANSTFESTAAVKPGRDVFVPGDEPLTWHIDLFAALEKNFPSIRSKEVFYTKLSLNSDFLQDPTQKKLTDTKIALLQDGNKKKSIKPSGQKAHPGDIIKDLAYNQKLQVYIKELNKTVWIAPTKGRKVQFLADDEPDNIEKARLEKQIVSANSENPETKTSTMPFQESLKDQLKKLTKPAQ